MIRTLAFIVLAVFGQLCFGAVYKCVDSEGNTSFSSIPCPTRKITGDSEAHQLWKDLKQFSIRGRTIVRSVAADVESIKACEVRARQYREALNGLSGKVDKLEKKHVEMVRAYQLLPECGVCQARGIARCDSADKHLEAAKNELVEIPEKEPPPWARKRPGER